MKLLIALAAIWLIAAPPALAQQPISPKEFRDRLVAAMQKERPGLCIQLKDDRTIYFGPSQTNCEFFAAIENQYLQYLNDPGSLDGKIKFFARNTIGIMTDDGITTADMDKLVLVLRPRGYAPKSVSFDFAGDLVALLMRDGEERMTSVSPDQLKAMGLSSDDAFRKALANLPARLGPQTLSKDYGVSLVSADSGLITGTLLLPDACGRLAGTLVFVFDRNAYATVDANDKKALANFWRFESGVVRGGISISSTVLSCKAGAWSVVDPPR